MVGLAPVGHVGGAIEGGATAGNLLAVSEGGALVVYEVVGGGLVRRGSTELPMPASAVVWDGNVVYAGLSDPTVADPNERHGLAIVDATNPATPMLLGFRTYIAFSPQAARGGFVFGTDGALAFVDVRIPASPGSVQRINATTGAHRIAIAGDLLVAVGLDVWVMDLRQLPVIGTAIPVPGMSACACWRSVAVNPPHAYVGGGGVLVSILDLSRPELPVEVARQSWPLSVGELGTDGTKLFASPNQTFQGFQWSDLTNPRTPGPPVSVPGPARWLDLIGWRGLPGTELGLLPSGLGLVPVQDPQAAVIADIVGHVRRVAPVGDRLCLATATGVVTARIAIDGSLRALGMLAGAAHQIATAGNRAYAIRAGSLDVLDISTDVPRLLGSWRCGDVDQGAMALAVRQGLAFVVTGTSLRYDRAPRGGLWVVDLTDEANPTTIATRALAVPGRGIALDAGFAYVTMYGDFVRLSVFDIAMPAAPRSVADRLVDGYAGDVVVTGGVAYVATTTGLTILDVNDPARIRLLGTWVRDANPVGYTSTVPLIVQGHHAMLGSGAGVDVLDVATPASVTLRLRKRVGEARGLAVLANGGSTFLLSANGERGLTAFRLTLP